MPQPSDHPDYNLNLFATLGRNPRVDLAYSADKGTFSARRRTESTEGPAAPLEGYPVTSEEFANAARQLWTAASAWYLTGHVRPDRWRNAAVGLMAVRDAYRVGSEEERSLKRLVDDLKLIKAASRSKFADFISQQTANFMITAVRQDRYIGKDNPGVCAAFCFDWVSRKVHPLRNKASYLVAKKGPAGPAKGESVIEWASRNNVSRDLDMARMTRKIGKLMQPLQDAHASALSHGERGYRFDPAGFAKTKHPRYYNGLTIQPFQNGPRNCAINLRELPARNEGEQVFGEILNWCVPLTEHSAIRPADPLYWLNPNATTRMYDDMRKKYVSHDPGFLPFVVGLRTSTSNVHAVALCRTRFGWQFFDPNFGEFEFPESSKDQFLSLANRLWIYYRMTASVCNWELYHVYYSPPEFRIPPNSSPSGQNSHAS
jgi:hypothetical protein